MIEEDMQEHIDAHNALQRVLDKLNALQDAMHEVQAERDGLHAEYNDAAINPAYLSKAIMLEAPTINLVENAIKMLNSAAISLANARNYTS